MIGHGRGYVFEVLEMRVALTLLFCGVPEENKMTMMLPRQQQQRKPQERRPLLERTCVSGYFRRYPPAC